MLPQHASRLLLWNARCSPPSVLLLRIVIPSIVHYTLIQKCNASSSSSTRWKSRQSQDPFARDAKVQGLKSRAAFKLLQINDKHHIFNKGDTVVDLGYAPGSWSQVAANRTAPRGRVIGVDLLPAQPPKGVSAILGDFLSPAVQAEVRAYVLDGDRGRPLKAQAFYPDLEPTDVVVDEDVEASRYIDMGRKTTPEAPDALSAAVKDFAGILNQEELEHMNRMERDKALGRVVDVVLSDMDEPWQQTIGFGSKSISNPYRRMMSTSGISFKDHAGSMDLCTAALNFCFDTLKSGGHFICKFYQGAEDKAFENKLKRLFEKVHRDKPAASRTESREGFFVALRRKETPARADVFAD